MKIKFTRGAAGIGLAYSPGMELECAKPFGKEMIELGVAIELEPDANGDLPDNFPAREVLVGLGISLDEVKALNTIEQLTALKGIGKVSATNILNYLKA